MIGSKCGDGLRPFCSAPRATWESTKYNALVYIAVGLEVLHLTAVRMALNSRALICSGRCHFCAMTVLHFHHCGKNVCKAAPLIDGCAGPLVVCISLPL